MYTKYFLISNYSKKNQNLLFEPWLECLPWAWFSSPHKLGVLVQSYNPITQEVKGRGLGV